MMMNVVDALERTSEIKYVEVKWGSIESSNDKSEQEEKKESTLTEEIMVVELPGAADGTNAREVICAARKSDVLITAFHPELTEDYR